VSKPSSGINAPVTPSSVLAHTAATLPDHRTVTQLRLAHAAVTPPAEQARCAPKPRVGLPLSRHKQPHRRRHRRYPPQHKSECRTARDRPTCSSPKGRNSTPSTARRCHRPRGRPSFAAEGAVGACSVLANAAEASGGMQSSAGEGPRHRNATHSAVVPPAGGRLHGPMMRKSNRARSTSNAALLLL
jgi:hypothetical protein